MLVLTVLASAGLFFLTHANAQTNPSVQCYRQDSTDTAWAPGANSSTYVCEDPTNRCQQCQWDYTVCGLDRWPWQQFGGEADSYNGIDKEQACNNAASGSTQIMLTYPDASETSWFGEGDGVFDQKRVSFSYEARNSLYYKQASCWWADYVTNTTSELQNYQTDLLWEYDADHENPSQSNPYRNQYIDWRGYQIWGPGELSCYSSYYGWGERDELDLFPWFLGDTTEIGVSVPCVPYDDQVSFGYGEPRDCPVTCTRADADLPQAPQFRPLYQFYEDYRFCDDDTERQHMFEFVDSVCSGLEECTTAREDGVWSNVITFDCNGDLYLSNKRLSFDGAGFSNILNEVVAMVEDGLKCHARDTEQGGDASLSDADLDKLFGLNIMNIFKALDPETPESWYPSLGNIGDFSLSMKNIWDTLQMEFNSDCSYASMMAGRGCQVKVPLPTTQAFVSVSMGPCPAGGPGHGRVLPFFQLNVTGAPFDDFMVPCQSDADCQSSHCEYISWDSYTNYNGTLDFLKSAFFWPEGFGDSLDVNGMLMQAGEYFVQEMLKSARESFFGQSPYNMAGQGSKPLKFCGLGSWKVDTLYGDPANMDLYPGQSATDADGNREGDVNPGPWFTNVGRAFTGDNATQPWDYLAFNNETIDDFTTCNKGGLCLKMNPEFLMPNSGGAALDTDQLYSTYRRNILTGRAHGITDLPVWDPANGQTEIDFLATTCSGDIGLFPKTPGLSFIASEGGWFVDAVNTFASTIRDLVDARAQMGGPWGDSVLSTAEFVQNYMWASFGLGLSVLNDEDGTVMPQVESPLEALKDLWTNSSSLGEDDMPGFHKYVQMPKSCTLEAWQTTGKCIVASNVLSEWFSTKETLDIKMVFSAEQCPGMEESGFARIRLYCSGDDCDSVFVPMSNDFCTSSADCDSSKLECLELPDVPPFVSALWGYPTNRRSVKQLQCSGQDDTTVMDSCNMLAQNITTLRPTQRVSFPSGEAIMPMNPLEFDCSTNAKAFESLMLFVAENYFYASRVNSNPYLYSNYYREFTFDIAAVPSGPSYTVLFKPGSSNDLYNYENANLKTLWEDASDTEDYYPGATDAYCENEWTCWGFEYPLSATVGLIASQVPFNSESNPSTWEFRSFNEWPFAWPGSTSYADIFGEGFMCEEKEWVSDTGALDPCKGGIYVYPDCTAVGYDTCSNPKLTQLQLMNLFHRVAGRGDDQWSLTGYSQDETHGICWITADLESISVGDNSTTWFETDYVAETTRMCIPQLLCEGPICNGEPVPYCSINEPDGCVDNVCQSPYVCEDITWPDAGFDLEDGYNCVCPPNTNCDGSGTPAPPTLPPTTTTSTFAPEVDACIDNPCTVEPETVCTDITSPEIGYELNTPEGRRCSCPANVECDPACSTRGRQGTTLSEGCGGCISDDTYAPPNSGPNAACLSKPEVDGCAETPCPAGNTCYDCMKDGNATHCPNGAKYWDPTARYCEDPNADKDANDCENDYGRQVDATSQCDGVDTGVSGCGCCRNGFVVDPFSDQKACVRDIPSTAATASPASFVALMLAAILALQH